MRARDDDSSRMSTVPLQTGECRRTNGAPVPPWERTWDCRPARRVAENPAVGSIQIPPLQYRRRKRHRSARTPQEKSANSEFTGPYLQIGGAPLASEAVCAATVSRSSIHLANASTSVEDRPCASLRRASAH